MIKIDKNVPIPRQMRANARFPFAEMEVGDSFLVEGASPNSIASSASSYAKRNGGLKFTTKRLDDGTRVWRVA